ncbi:MAG TPA: hypothetical protein VNO82_25935 [Solirubrobacteraceae bacterium]|nr:hypothetical protein [Solirubrobacteraceae bacterium]
MPLRAVIEALPARPAAPPGRWERLMAGVRSRLARLAAWSGFPTALARLFQVWGRDVARGGSATGAS